MSETDALGMLGALVLIALMAAGSRRRARSRGRPRIRFPDGMDIPHRAAPQEDVTVELARLRTENRDMADLLRLAFSTSPTESAAFDRLRAERQAQDRIDRLEKNPRLMESLRALGASIKDLDHPDVMKEHFRRRAKATHPDAGGSEDDFRAVADAWNYLKTI